MSHRERMRPHLHSVLSSPARLTTAAPPARARASCRLSPSYRPSQQTSAEEAPSTSRPESTRRTSGGRHLAPRERVNTMRSPASGATGLPNNPARAAPRAGLLEGPNGLGTSPSRGCEPIAPRLGLQGTMETADDTLLARRRAIDALCAAAARADLEPRALLRPLAALASAVLGARDPAGVELELVPTNVWRRWAAEERDGGLRDVFDLCARIADAQLESAAIADRLGREAGSGRSKPAAGETATNSLLVPPDPTTPPFVERDAIDVQSGADLPPPRRIWYSGEFDELSAPLFAALGDSALQDKALQQARLGAEAWLRAAPAGALFLSCAAQLADARLERVGGGRQARGVSPLAAVAEQTLVRLVEPADGITRLVAWICDGDPVSSPSDCEDDVEKARRRAASTLLSLPELGDAVASCTLGSRNLVLRLAEALVRAPSRSLTALNARAELVARLSSRGGAEALAQALTDVCLCAAEHNGYSEDEEAAAAVFSRVDAADAWLRVAMAGLVDFGALCGASFGGAPTLKGSERCPSSSSELGSGFGQATKLCLRFLAVMAPPEHAGHRRLLRDRVPLRGALPGPAVSAVVRALYGPCSDTVAADRAEMPSELTTAARQVSLAWGDKEAVRGRSASFLTHRTRTYFLICALRKLANVDPSERLWGDAMARDVDWPQIKSPAINTSVGLVPALLSGVASHLDSSDDPVRECGMRVGTALAALVQPDKPGPFDGLIGDSDDADYWNDRRGAAEARLMSAMRGASSAAPPARARRPKRGGERPLPRPKPAVSSWIDPGVETETDSDDDARFNSGRAPRRAGGGVLGRHAVRRRHASGSLSSSAASSRVSTPGSSSELSFSESEGDSTGASGPSSSDDSDEEKALLLQFRDLPGALAGFEQDWRAALRALWASEAMLTSGVEEARIYAPRIASALLRFRPPPWAGREAPRGAPADALRVRAAAVVAAVVADPLLAGMAAIEEVFSASSDVQTRVDALGALASAAGELRTPGSALPLRAGADPGLLSRGALGGEHAGFATRAPRRAPQPLPSRGAVFSAWASALLRRAGTPTHGLDMLGRDAFVLSRVLVALSAMLEACGGCHESETLAAASLEFARLDAVHGSGEPAVRRATALLVASALDAVPRHRLLEALLLEEDSDDESNDASARDALESVLTTKVIRDGSSRGFEGCTRVRGSSALLVEGGRVSGAVLVGDGNTVGRRVMGPGLGARQASREGSGVVAPAARVSELLDAPPGDRALPASLLDLAAPDRPQISGTVESHDGVPSIPRWLCAPEALLASDLRWASRWLDSAMKDPDPVTADSAKAAGQLRDAFAGDAIRLATSSRPRTLAEGGELLLPAVDLGSAAKESAADLVLPSADRAR